MCYVFVCANGFPDNISEYLCCIIVAGSQIVKQLKRLNFLKCLSLCDMGINTVD